MSLILFVVSFNKMDMQVSDGCGDVGEVVDFEPRSLAFASTRVGCDEDK